MDALLEPKTVGDITGAFYVPAYQRGYRWGADEVDRLLSDIWASEGKPYYLQPIVVKAMPDGRLELIDGQQRLTTLYLIFNFMQTHGLQSAGAGYTMEYETREGSQAFLQAPNADERETTSTFITSMSPMNTSVRGLKHTITDNSGLRTSSTATSSRA